MSFFKNNSYEIVRLFVIRVGIMIFSMIVMMAAVSAVGGTLATAAVSVFSVVFYLFIIYSTMWHVGYKRGERQISGRGDGDKWYGAKVALFASLPNIFLCFLMAIGLLQFVFTDSFLGAFYAIARLLEGLLNAMYIGLIGLPDLESAPLDAALTTALSILSVLPAIITSQIACRFGEKNIRLTKDKPKLD